jgi:hypothetical protein
MQKRPQTLQKDNKGLIVMFGSVFEFFSGIFVIFLGQKKWGGGGFRGFLFLVNSFVILS